MPHAVNFISGGFEQFTEDFNHHIFCNVLEYNYDIAEERTTCQVLFHSSFKEYKRRLLVFFYTL